MRLERSNAKTLLVIEEEVDLGREKVTMIHGEVYALVRKWVSVETEEIFGVQSRLECAVRKLTKAGHREVGSGCNWSPLTFGPEVFECAPELMAGAMDVGLHRTQRQIEGRRNLLVGASFDMTEQDA